MIQHINYCKRKMTIISLVLIFISCATGNSHGCCSKFSMETQYGTGTIGTAIRGKVYVPGDQPGGHWTGSGDGMALWQADDCSWYELSIKDGESPCGIQMFLQIEPVASLGHMMLHESCFRYSCDDIRFSNIYFKVWDRGTNTYAYYGSVATQCEVNITKVDDGVVSGFFKGKFVRYDDPKDFIEIADGRFDINGFALLEGRS